MAELVVIDYAELTQDGGALAEKIRAAYGPDGLGILTVRGVPDFPARRQRLLPLAARFASLPEAIKARYEDPASNYNFGWSCGREVLQHGQPDVLKGSFYANPLCDVPTTDADLLARYPGYCRPNIWPREDLPELEAAFKELGELIVGVGLLVAKCCGAYAAAAGTGLSPTRLSDVIAASPCTKGRLLHYFPPAEVPSPKPLAGSSSWGRLESAAESAEFAAAAAAGGFISSASVEPEGGAAEVAGEWCGWHTDHGSLTGLTAAMYLRPGSPREEVACPDPAAGLYIRTRRGETVRAVIPQDHIAFQVGEAMQVHSGGVLQATPHCVRAPNPPTTALLNATPNSSTTNTNTTTTNTNTTTNTTTTTNTATNTNTNTTTGLSRCTFAVFMQPKWDEPLDLPPGGAAAEAGAGAGVDDHAGGVLGAAAEPSGAGGVHDAGAAAGRVSHNTGPEVGSLVKGGAGVAQWSPGITFGEFSERTFAAYYK